jgi:ribosomal protein S18 acetylase RimI-like enzyme
VRPAEADDAERIGDIARSSMTASYALSPDDIDAIADDRFETDAIRRRVASDRLGPYVAAVDDVLAGFVELAVDDGHGTVHWLHVDPERRGAGVGTALFERAVAELEDRAEHVRARTLAANTSSGSFFERLGFEQVDERRTELGGRETVQYVFASEGTAEADTADDRAATGDPAAETATPSPASTEESLAPTEREGVDLPDSVEPDDGETVFLGEQSVDGSKGGFVKTYVDRDRSEGYGYYCVNCGSTDAAVDSMERIRCTDCGNTSKAGEDYDASYL